MKLKIDMVDPASLKPLDSHPRRDARKSLTALGRLLDAYGFVQPVIARRKDRLLIDGHERLKANALRGRPDRLVPCVFLSALDDNQAAALHVALNNPAAQARFDSDKLARLLGCLLGGREPDDELARLTALSPRDAARLLENLQPLPPEPMRPAAEFLQPPGRPGTARHKPAASTVLVFELNQRKFRKAKSDFDKLIARHDLTCNVRIE